MSAVNRRRVLGAGAGAVGATVAGSMFQAGAAEPVSAEAASAARSGRSPYLFQLTRSKPNTFDGGSLRGAHEGNFPVLAGQDGSVYFVHLDVGGIREPHWHPTAWELTFVVSGRAKWTVLGTHPDGSYHNEVFEAEQGDLVFVPQSFFHYFENADRSEPMRGLVVFNTSSEEPNDDIGVVGTLNALPRDVLAACFGVAESAFDQVPREIRPVVITRHK